LIFRCLGKRLGLQGHWVNPWTVDRNEGVFLLRIGDHGPAATEEDFQKGIQYFSLWWKGVNVECKLWYKSQAPNAITWKQDWIDVPKEHMAHKKEIWDALKEALTVYQINGDAFRLSFGDPSLPPLSEIKFDF
jgi:hypothetical protein